MHSAVRVIWNDSSVVPEDGRIVDLIYLFTYNRNKCMKFVKLNTKQTDRLSEIVGNFGIVFFGALVIPLWTEQRLDMSILVKGMALTLICITGSMLLLQGGHS